jgi:hypothetical protein
MANVLANTARAIVTNRLKSSGTEPNNVGWGTSAGTAGVTDTTLFGEKALDLVTATGTRVAGTSTQQTTSTTNDTYQVVATLTATAGGTVTNAGLFDNSTIASGNLYAKADFTGIVLANGDSITFTFKAQYS